MCAATAAAAAGSKWRSAVRIAPGGLVLEPASSAFDVTVAPGENVQVAVDRCPPSGSVLLLPGTHDGPLVLTADKAVHVFGRGLATLRTATVTVVTCEAAIATLDGVAVLRECGGNSDNQCGCVWIKGGRLRLQACDVTSAAPDISSVVIEGGADPILVFCRCVFARSGCSLSLRLPVTCEGEGGIRGGTGLHARSRPVPFPSLFSKAWGARAHSSFL